MWDEERLFGFDMRHRTPPQIMPTLQSKYEVYDLTRKFQSPSFHRLEVEAIAGLFGMDVSSYRACTGTYYRAWKYGMKTSLYGHIAIDVFQENILLFPEAKFRYHIQQKLAMAGIVFSIVGDECFINIFKKDNKSFFDKLKSRKEKPS